jgi:hypothetical protein
MMTIFYKIIFQTLTQFNHKIDMKKWSDRDLKIAYEDACKYSSFEDLVEYLTKDDKLPETPYYIDMSNQDNKTLCDTIKLIYGDIFDEYPTSNWEYIQVVDLYPIDYYKPDVLSWVYIVSSYTKNDCIIDYNRWLRLNKK